MRREEPFIFLSGFLIPPQHCPLYWRLGNVQRASVCSAVKSRLLEALHHEQDSEPAGFFGGSLISPPSPFLGVSLVGFFYVCFFAFFLIRLFKSKVRFSGKMFVKEWPSLSPNFIVNFTCNEFWMWVNDFQGSALGLVLLGWARVASGFKA